MNTKTAVTQHFIDIFPPYHAARGALFSAIIASGPPLQQG
jgi:hypothetical protein